MPPNKGDLDEMAYQARVLLINSLENSFELKEGTPEFLAAANYVLKIITADINFPVT
jgi:hypothetical protein